MPPQSVELFVLYYTGLRVIHALPGAGALNSREALGKGWITRFHVIKAALGVYSLSPVASAQIILAFLLAKATAALLKPRRSISTYSQQLNGSLLSPQYFNTARAQWINKVHKRRLPRLLMPSNTCRSPLLCCLGTTPKLPA